MAAPPHNSRSLHVRLFPARPACTAVKTNKQTPPCVYKIDGLAVLPCGEVHPKEENRYAGFYSFFFFFSSSRVLLLGASGKSPWCVSPSPSPSWFVIDAVERDVSVQVQGLERAAARLPGKEGKAQGRSAASPFKKKNRKRKRRSYGMRTETRFYPSRPQKTQRTCTCRQTQRRRSITFVL